MPKRNQRHPEFRTEVAIEAVNGDEMRINRACPPDIMNTFITLSLCPSPGGTACAEKTAPVERCQFNGR